MASRMKIIFDGNKYVSKTTEEATAEVMKEAVYENFARMDKMTIDTDDGFIVFGKDVVQGCIIIFEEL